jgi:NAD(P)H-flavin reductase
MTPVLHRVVDRREEAGDVVTLSLSPVDGPPIAFAAGQFTMVTALGVGEAAISVSSAPGDPGPLQQTVRAVGPVTGALCRSSPGDLVGLRGPFGTDWGVDELCRAPGNGRFGDVVVVAGGIGLAPLRGAVRELLGAGARTGPEGVVEGGSVDGPRTFVMVGARQPEQVIFGDDLAAWSRSGARVATTVDVGTPGWDGHVGLVTTLLATAGFDPPSTTALVCGPEVMMRFTARALIEMGVDPGRIRVSLERNMQCGVAWCGHCQLGPLLLCRDGPVVAYGGAVARLMSERGR